MLGWGTDVPCPSLIQSFLSCALTVVLGLRRGLFTAQLTTLWPSRVVHRTVTFLLRYKTYKVRFRLINHTRDLLIEGPPLPQQETNDTTSQRGRGWAHGCCTNHLVNSSQRPSHWCQTTSQPPAGWPCPREIRHLSATGGPVLGQTGLRGVYLTQRSWWPASDHLRTPHPCHNSSEMGPAKKWKPLSDETLRTPSAYIVKSIYSRWTLSEFLVLPSLFWGWYLSFSPRHHLFHYYWMFSVIRLGVLRPRDTSCTASYPRTFIICSRPKKFPPAWLGIGHTLKM